MKPIRLTLAAFLAIPVMLCACAQPPVTQQGTAGSSSISAIETPSPSVGQMEVLPVQVSSVWTSAGFPTESEYHHSLDMMVPPYWEFRCCGDTDVASNHLLFLPEDAGSVVAAPAIVVSDRSLVLCPDNRPLGCSIDQLKPATAQAYYKSAVAYHDGDDVEGYERTGTLALPGFPSDVVIYRAPTISSPDGDEVYLIQTARGVVYAIFTGGKSIDETLKKDFLGKIR